MALVTKSREFNPRTFLSTIGKGRRMMPFQRKAVIFVQGEPSDGLFFIQEGKIRLSVVSEAGKEATLGVLGEDDFFGEGGLAGQLVRMSSATAMTDCVLLHVDKKAMLQAMSLEPKLSATFVKYLLKRNIRYQDDLVDQLFNSSEKRLARILLLMAHFGQEGIATDMLIPRLSQETLSEMVGTTRSRVSFFMNKFRKLGFIKYDNGENLLIHSSLLGVVLNDDTGTPTSDTETPTARARKGLEPPARPGGPRETERAKNPPLPKP
jgi:CRP/FNR family cyclic AMP-dependent transcriptional regulator